MVLPVRKKETTVINKVRQIKWNRLPGLIELIVDIFWKTHKDIRIKSNLSDLRRHEDKDQMTVTKGIDTTLD